MSNAPVRLLIAITSGRGWCSRFGHRLASMTLHLGMNGVKGADGKNRLERCALMVNHGAYLTIARESHMVKAKAEGFTHLLSLDDDMTFPVDCVERMLAHDKAVVTCNYRKKIQDRTEMICASLDGGMVDSANKTGLEKIAGMGMGITLIDVAKVAHVPRPYFEVLWDEDKQEFDIEDGVFSLRLRNHDVDLWCDHDLSQEVGHVGEVEFLIPKITSFGVVKPLENHHEVQAQAAG